MPPIIQCDPDLFGIVRIQRLHTRRTEKVDLLGLLNTPEQGMPHRAGWHHLPQGGQAVVFGLHPRHAKTALV